MAKSVRMLTIFSAQPESRLIFRKMASRKGFEPLTPGLGNLCSIQLSYRDAAGIAIARCGLISQS